MSLMSSGFCQDGNEPSLFIEGRKFVILTRLFKNILLRGDGWFTKLNILISFNFYFLLFIFINFFNYGLIKFLRKRQDSDRTLAHYNI